MFIALICDKNTPLNILGKLIIIPKTDKLTVCMKIWQHNYLFTYVPDAFTQYDQTINYYTCTAVNFDRYKLGDWDKHNLHISVKRLHRDVYIVKSLC